MREQFGPFHTKHVRYENAQQVPINMIYSTSQITLYVRVSLLLLPCAIFKNRYCLASQITHPWHLRLDAFFRLFLVGRILCHQGGGKMVKFGKYQTVWCLQRWHLTLDSTCCIVEFALHGRLNARDVLMAIVGWNTRANNSFGRDSTVKFNFDCNLHSRLNILPQNAPKSVVTMPKWRKWILDLSWRTLMRDCRRLNSSRSFLSKIANLFSRFFLVWLISYSWKREKIS